MEVLTHTFGQWQLQRHQREACGTGQPEGGRQFTRDTGDFSLAAQQGLNHLAEHTRSTSNTTSNFERTIFATKILLQPSFFWGVAL
jgi:hypothetical protein